MAAEEGRNTNGPDLKSKESLVLSFIRFQNTTRRRIDIIWMNYEGHRVKYQSIDQGKFLDVNTFVGHPWIFCDSETGERMVVSLSEVFQPTAWNRDSSHLYWPPKRKVVNITIPVYSLQDCCLRAIKKHVPSNKIEKLDVTDILKDEIYKIFRINRPSKPSQKRIQSPDSAD